MEQVRQRAVKLVPDYFLINYKSHFITSYDGSIISGKIEKTVELYLDESCTIRKLQMLPMMISVIGIKCLHTMNDLDALVNRSVRVKRPMCIITIIYNH